MRCPYEQETACVEANTPLFQILFPHSTTAVNQSTATTFANPRAGTRPVLSLPMRTLGLFDVAKRRDGSTEASSISVAVDAVAYDIEPAVAPHTAGETQHEGEEDDELKESDVQRLAKDVASVDARAQVPFRTRLRETQQRFKEQMEVHRGISAAMSRLTSVEHDIRLQRAEQRTMALVATLHERQEAAFGSICPSERIALAAATSPTPWSDIRAAAGLPPKAPSGTPPYTSPTTRVPAAVVASVGSPASTRASSPAPTVTNPLLDILEAFSKPRRSPTTSEQPSIPTVATGSGGRARGSAAVKPRRKLAVEVVYPEEAPQPYTITRYRIVDTPLPTAAPSGKALTDWLGDPPAPPTAAAIATAAPSEVHTSSVGTENQTTYTEDFTSVVSEVQDSVVAAEEDDASSSSGDAHRGGASGSRRHAAAHSATPHAASTADSTQSTVTSEHYTSIHDNVVEKEESDEDESTVVPATDTTAADDVSSEVQDDTVTRRRTGESTVTFTEALRQFKEACRQANQLVNTISGGATTRSARPSGHAVRQWLHDEKRPGENQHGDAHVDDDAAWQLSLRNEFRNIRRLRRFIKRLRDNVKAMDLQRQTHAAKMALLRKAQTLAKVRQRLHRDPGSRLRKVARTREEREALQEGGGPWSSRRRRGGDSIDDEMGSVEDDISDEMGSFAMSGGGSDSVEDELEDEVDGDAVGSDDFDVDDEVEDSIDDELGSGSGGDAVEDSVVDLAVGELDDEVEAALDSDAALDEVEDELANHLAEASDLDEVAEEVDNLSYDLESTAAGSGASDAIDDEVEASAAKSSTASVADSIMTESAGSGGSRRHKRAHRDDGSVSTVRTDNSIDDAVGFNASAGGDGGHRRKRPVPGKESPYDSVSDVSGSRRRKPSGTSSLSSQHSLPSLTHSSDADVSTLFPATSSSPGNRTSDSDDAAAAASASGEAALRDLELDLALTQSRRTRAIHAPPAAPIPTFSQLYDPSARPAPASSSSPTASSNSSSSVSSDSSPAPSTASSAARDPALPKTSATSAKAMMVATAERRPSSVDEAKTTPSRVEKDKEAFTPLHLTVPSARTPMKTAAEAAPPSPIPVPLPKEGTNAAAPKALETGLPSEGFMRRGVRAERDEARDAAQAIDAPDGVEAPVKAVGPSSRRYDAEDYVALRSWKEQQLALFKQIFDHNTEDSRGNRLDEREEEGEDDDVEEEEEDKDMNDSVWGTHQGHPMQTAVDSTDHGPRGDISVVALKREEEAAHRARVYHWSRMEALLERRFGAASDADAASSVDAAREERTCRSVRPQDVAQSNSSADADAEVSRSTTPG